MLPGLSIAGAFLPARVGRMPDVAKPRGDLKRLGIGGRFFGRGLGKGRERHAQLSVAVIEFTDEHLLVFGHEDSADDSISLSNYPGGCAAIATRGHGRIPFVVA